MTETKPALNGGIGVASGQMRPKKTNRKWVCSLPFGGKNCKFSHNWKVTLTPSNGDNLRDSGSHATT